MDEKYHEPGYLVSCYVTAMTPSIGRIVHYTDENRVVQAAIITGVNSRSSGEVLTVSLHIFMRESQYDLLQVEWSEWPSGSIYAKGKWSWPARD